MRHDVACRQDAAGTGSLGMAMDPRHLDSRCRVPLRGGREEGARPAVAGTTEAGRGLRAAASWRRVLRKPTRAVRSPGGMSEVKCMLGS